MRFVETDHVICSNELHALFVWYMFTLCRSTLFLNGFPQGPEASAGCRQLWVRRVAAGGITVAELSSEVCAGEMEILLNNLFI